MIELSPVTPVVRLALSVPALSVHDYYCGLETNWNLWCASRRVRGPGPPFSTMYERIEVTCDCGWHPTRLREVGLTVDRQLVIYWRCSHCRRQVYRIKPLAECWRECPTPAPSSPPAVSDSMAPLKAT